MGVKHRVGKSEAQVKCTALHSGTETNALNFEFFNEAIGNTLDHIGDEATGGAVHGTQLAVFGGTRHAHRSVFLLNANSFRQSPLQFTLRPFDREAGVISHFNLDLLGEADLFFTYPRHGMFWLPVFD